MIRILLGYLVLVCVLCVLLVPWQQKESFERPDFFPSNEVNIVQKRIPNSTVVDCRWNMVTPSFDDSDPVYYAYNNQG